MAGETNGAKWQVGFWVLTIISGACIAGLTGAMVANDIRYTQEHKELYAEIVKSKESIRLEMKEDINHSLNTLRGELSALSQKIDDINSNMNRYFRYNVRRNYSSNGSEGPDR